MNKNKRKNDRRDLLIDDMALPEKVNLTPEEDKEIEERLKKQGII